MPEPNPFPLLASGERTPFTPSVSRSPRYVLGDRRTEGWVDGGFENLCCPLQHHVKDGALMLSEDVFRCRFKPQAGARECGILIWTLYNVRANALYSAEVDMKDLDIIRQHHTVTETMHYLGAAMWPRVRTRHPPYPRR